MTVDHQQNTEIFASFMADSFGIGGQPEQPEQPEQSSEVVHAAAKSNGSRIVRENEARLPSHVRFADFMHERFGYRY